MPGRVPGRSSAYPDERNREEIPLHIQTTIIMKTNLVLLMTALMFISCSSDSDSEAAVQRSASGEGSIAGIDYPANSANSFDFKGKKIYEALAAYSQKKQHPNSVSELAQQIGFISEKLDLKAAPTARIIPFTDEMVQSILEDPDQSMILIIQNSALQSGAKTSLIDFLQQLISERRQEFSFSYNYITGYESDVINNPTFTAEEKETMLTAASIARYSLYSEKERKDKDWDILVGGKPAKPFFEMNQVPLVSLIALLDRLV